MFIKLTFYSSLLCAVSLAHFIITAYYDDSCDRKYHLRSCIVLCVLSFLALFVFGYLFLFFD